VRFAPPLVVEKSDLVWALEQIGEVLGAVSPVHH
jgi:acetylornithine/succinyldiaminopimelate/putrescine aminotransferase